MDISHFVREIWLSFKRLKVMHLSTVFRNMKNFISTFAFHKRVWGVVCYCSKTMHRRYKNARIRYFLFKIKAYLSFDYLIKIITLRTFFSYILSLKYFLTFLQCQLSNLWACRITIQVQLNAAILLILIFIPESFWSLG